MSDLKPCPFCGNDDIQDWGESTWSRPVKWFYCAECHAQCPRVMLERNESDEAWQQRIIAAWNDRATPDPVINDPRVKALVEQVRALLVAADGESYAAYNAALEATDAALRAIGGEA